MEKTSFDWLVEPTKITVMSPDKLFYLIKLNLFQRVQSSGEILNLNQYELQLDYHKWVIMFLTFSLKEKVVNNELLQKPTSLFFFS